MRSTAWPAQDWDVAEAQTVSPGALRDREVSVGLHIAPAAASVPMFIDRWASRYGQVRRGEAAWVAMACAHQRLGWIHPFMDGKARVMRLHSHTVLSVWATPTACGHPCAALRALKTVTTPCWPMPAAPAVVI